MLKDPRALRAFQDFAVSIHAGENVAVWWVVLFRCTSVFVVRLSLIDIFLSRVAIEFFKMQHVSTPSTKKIARKRLSEQLGNLHLDDEQDEETALFSHADPRFTVRPFEPSVKILLLSRRTPFLVNLQFRRTTTLTLCRVVQNNL